MNYFEFDISKMYRKGLLQLLYSASLQSIPPFSQHCIEYHSYGKEGTFEICEFECHQNFETFDGYPDGRGLPEKYKKLNLINGCVDPVWFIYLLTSDFDMQQYRRILGGR